MTLAETLLEKLSNWTPGPGRQELLVRDAETGWSLRLSADRKDDVGCLVHDLTFERAASATGDVRAWAEAVVKRVTGLIEPLKIIEVDGTRNEALLRSAKAQRRDGKRLYHELLLRGTNHASLRRFKAGSAGKREQVSFALTHESIADVAANISGASLSS